MGSCACIEAAASAGSGATGATRILERLESPAPCGMGAPCGGMGAPCGGMGAPCGGMGPPCGPPGSGAAGRRAIGCAAGLTRRFASPYLSLGIVLPLFRFGPERLQNVVHPRPHRCEVGIVRQGREPLHRIERNDHAVLQAIPEIPLPIEHRLGVADRARGRFEGNRYVMPPAASLALPSRSLRSRAGRSNTRTGGCARSPTARIRRRGRCRPVCPGSF